MEEDAIVEPRVKRQKKDKFGRFVALQKLKQLKGSKSKHKYEVDDVDNVYETIDEVEYTKKVLRQQEEDWIVDDDGSGYIEDGRDIFDDDLDDKSIAQASKSKGTKRKKKAVCESAGKSNLQYMLSNMPNKKKEDVALDNDDVLSELISEIDNPDAAEPVTKSAKKAVSIKPQSSRFSLIAEKKAAKDYMKSFVVNKSANRIKIENVKEKVAVDDKENIVENGIVENVVEEVEKEKVDVVEEKEEVKPPSSAKSKLLFTIEEPKVKEEPISSQENKQENEMFTEADFDDDFDFDMDMDIDMKAEVKTETENVVTEEQLLEGCVFSVNNAETEVEQECEPEVLEENDKEGFLFYWWDAFEDPKNQPGVVLLFGKTFSKETKKYVSCCVVVKNIERKVYLLPRQFYLDENNRPTEKPVTMVDVYNEFNNVIAPHFNLQSYKSKKVTKNYAFDPTVPAQSEYLEVRFQGEMQVEKKSYKTISNIFGINSSFLEIFLLERKIKGPCWLKVFNSEESKNPFTYTALEMKCPKPSDIVVLHSSKPLPPPPLVVLTLNVKIATSKSSTVQIALISGLVNYNYYVNKHTPNPPFQEHFCILSKLADQALPLDIHVALSKYKATKVQKLDSERALLNYFLAQFSKIDPDLIVGFDMNDSILADRLQAANATNFSRLSRIKRVNKSLNRFKLQRQMFAGRLVCDIKISAKELIKSRSYDLETLCSEVLKVPEHKRIEIEPELVGKMYERSVDLFKMISITMQDTVYILRIMYELQVIPLALQITNIAGNIMSRTLTGGRSERNEYLLLHAFTEKDYIVPEKRIREKNNPEESTKSRNKKPTYLGGLVLDPKVGFYDHLVLLMDFNSLYPSIIQEYNICFTTIEEKPNAEEAVLPDKSLPAGILPTEIRKLVESRREVKKLMAVPDLAKEIYQQYHIRQMALKLTANSMYGCLGFSHSRFFGKSLAALVTHKGREILTNTKDLVQKLNFDVIYGDTDSIMINTHITDYEQVMSIGKSIKAEVNKLYRQVELDIDGVFKYLLLLKKKKYAAVSLQKGKNGTLREITEFKGLDIVRRDWSQLSAETGKFILGQILSEQTQDERIANIHTHLEKIKTDIEENKVPLPLFVITKQLTKEPHMYTEKNSLPHVQVALRYNKSHAGKKFKAGDTVDYVICNDGTNNSAVMRAYLLDELKASESLKIDPKYYLAQQIHPVVSRICEPIEGTDSYQIANCLGLDGASFKQPSRSTSDKPELTLKKPEQKFRNVNPFTFNCISCKSELTMSLCVNSDTLDKCTNMKCEVRPVEYLGFIQNKLQMQIRDYIKKYYKYELTCEDPACTQVTFRLPQSFYNRFPICTLCKSGVMYKSYTEEDLYMQILFFQHVFDFNNLKKKIDPNLEEAYNTLKEMVENTLRHSAYGNLDLGKLFKDDHNNKVLALDSTQLLDEDGNEDI